MSMIRPGGEDPATQIARVISRRKFLDRSLRGLTTGAVALFATGRIFSGTSSAAGDECFCAPPRGVECIDCPPGRHKDKCPPGHQRCRTVDGEQQCPGCVYEHGWWVACTGLGEGFGYKICIDCWRPDDCNTTCGCRSKVICGHCTSAADVKAEMALAMAADA